MTSREQPNSNGVKRWLHPNTKGRRTDEHRASLTVRQCHYLSFKYSSHMHDDR